MSVYAIETVGLTKKYGLLGRNGAGKTTTMKMLLNLARPTSGTIRLFGDDYKQQPDKTYRKIVSIIETPGFYDNLTGRENLIILARLRGRNNNSVIDRALETVGLDPIGIHEIRAFLYFKREDIK